MKTCRGALACGAWLGLALLSACRPGSGAGSIAASGGGAGTAQGTGGNGGAPGGAGGSSAGSGGATATCAPGLPVGFAALPEPFSLPAPRCNTPFDRLGDSTSGGTDFSLLDLGADRRPDLVVYRDACDASVGAAHWDVYAAGPAGFAATPEPYSLPAPRCNTSFDRLGDSTSGGIDFSLLDLGADGRPDLVVYRDACDASVGATHWDVYTAGPAGFAATPEPYSLPAPRCNTSFDRLGDSTSGGIDFSLLDLGADGRPDLVVYRDACDASVGATHWDVYTAGPTGFGATPERFSLPAPRCNTSFDRLADASSGGIDFSLLNLAADGRPDLVVYRDACEALVGSARWDVYAAGPSGFAPAPAAFTLPAPRCNTPFDRLGDSASGGIDFALLDLSCDDHPEIVLYRDACDAEVGATRWDVYLAGNGGFSPSPSALSTPAARCNTSFDQLSDSTSGDIGFDLLGLASKDRPDIVVFRDPCDGAVGGAHWDTYSLE